MFTARVGSLRALGGAQGSSLEVKHGLGNVRVAARKAALLPQLQFELRKW